MEFLHAPGHPHRPAGVAEVPANLPHDRGHRVGHEVEAAVRIETVDGLDQAESGDLQQILVRLAAPTESAGDVIGEGKATCDDFVAQRGRLPGRFVQGSQARNRGRHVLVVVSAGTVPLAAFRNRRH